MAPPNRLAADSLRFRTRRGIDFAGAGHIGGPYLGLRGIGENRPDATGCGIDQFVNREGMELGLGCFGRVMAILTAPLNPWVLAPLASR